MDTSVKRILREKFRLRLLDNPYLQLKNKVISENEAFMEKGKESKRTSLVLLKNGGNIIPLKQWVKMYLRGFDKKFKKNPFNIQC